MRVTSTCYPGHVTYLAYDPDPRSPKFSLHKDDPAMPTSEEITLYLTPNSKVDYYVILPGGERCAPMVTSYDVASSTCDRDKVDEGEKCVADFSPVGNLPPSKEPYEGEVPQIVTREMLEDAHDDDASTQKGLDQDR